MDKDNPFNRIEMAAGTWAVMCLGRPLEDKDLGPGDGPDGGRGPALATRSGFPDRESAVIYATSISPSWRPVIAKLETP